MGFHVEQSSLPESAIAPQARNIATFPDTLEPDRRPLAATITACFMVIAPHASSAHQLVNPARCDADQISKKFNVIEASSSSRKITTTACEPSGRSQDKDRWASDASNNTWILPASGRIFDLAARPEGWKGEGSVSPSGDVITDSLALLRRLESEGCNISPMISAEDDGGIIFFWKADDTLLSFSVDGSGDYSFFAKDANASVIDDDVPISDPLPEAVVRLFPRINDHRN